MKKRLKKNVNFRKHLFGIPPDETQFSKRGFQAASPAIRQYLETVGQTFVEGYHIVLLDDRLDAVTQELENISQPLRGFAYEGAAMAMALLDFISLKQRNRLQQFLQGAGAAHTYMVHVGAGWAWARLPRSLDRARRALDPLLGWLAIDGFGFHEGYFHSATVVDQAKVPRRIKGYAQRVFDQGLGRSLWFIKGADIEAIAATINTFPVVRQADLWSGIGLAATYAGGVDETILKQLHGLAHDFWPQLAQGSAFAAEARQRAGNLVAHTDVACHLFCHTLAAQASQVTQDTLVDLPPGDDQIPAYELWRQRIQDHFAKEFST